MLFTFRQCQSKRFARSTGLMVTSRSITTNSTQSLVRNVKTSVTFLLLVVLMVLATMVVILSPPNRAGKTLFVFVAHSLLRFGFAIMLRLMARFQASIPSLPMNISSSILAEFVLSRSQTMATLFLPTCRIRTSITLFQGRRFVQRTFTIIFRSTRSMPLMT